MNMVTLESLVKHKETIAVVGLGYVGLPLAAALSAYFRVLGFDRSQKRIQELIAGNDSTLEVSREKLANAGIHFSADPESLCRARFIIVAVPTPIDAYRNPDLSPLRHASELVGKNLAPGTCVVFESTVFPGATEEVCIPIMEVCSGLKAGKDFTVGYSPERINPGDKLHSIENIVKIVSGLDVPTLDLISGVYGKVVTAGLHRAGSIRVAEAAKVIENTQRDLNIALMNELAMIFDKIGIDTTEVIEAAATKWNFLEFRPGLVGGHCIGVDPYYLTFKAESLGYHPEMILAGRRINDGMGKFVAERIVKMLIRMGKRVQNARVAVLGITFKENVPDLRNTKIVDIVKELKDYGINVFVHDPLAPPEEAKAYYGIELVSIEKIREMEGVVISVKHDYYQKMGISGIKKMLVPDTPLLADLKGLFPPDKVREAGMAYWRL